jgi:hypothetical protein
MSFYAVYLDHVQLKVFPFDPELCERALQRAKKLADGFAETYGAHRITIEDRVGAIVYKPQGANHE